MKLSQAGEDENVTDLRTEDGRQAIRKAYLNFSAQVNKKLNAYLRDHYSRQIYFKNAFQNDCCFQDRGGPRLIDLAPKISYYCMVRLRSSRPTIGLL